jgi:hypothetical protein
MDPREIAEACEKAAHLSLDIKALNMQIESMDVHVTFWGREAEKALCELVAILNERLRDKEVK